MTKLNAQRWLTAAWLSGTVVILGLLILQTTVGDLWDADREAVWEWFLKALLPTATLMLGVVVSARPGPSEHTVQTHTFAFALALGLTVFYLFAISLVLVTMSLRYSIDPMDSANLWLTGVQGLTNAALGAFFVTSGHGNGNGAQGGR